MRQRKSFFAFWEGVKKHWLLPVVLEIAGLVGLLLGRNIPVIPQWLAWLFVVAGVFLAGYLSYRDLYIDFQLKVEKPIRLAKRVLTYRERLRIDRMAGQLETIHGHDDRDGIENDVIEGWDWDDIPSRKCSRCLKPRDKEGGLFYE